MTRGLSIWRSSSPGSIGTRALASDFIRIHPNSSTGTAKVFCYISDEKKMNMANNTKGVHSIIRTKRHLEYFILENATIMKQIKEFVEIKHASKLEKAGEKQSDCLFPAVLVQNDGRKDLY